MPDSRNSPGRTKRLFDSARKHWKVTGVSAGLTTMGILAAMYLPRVSRENAADVINDQDINAISWVDAHIRVSPNAVSKDGSIRPLDSDAVGEYTVWTTLSDEDGKVVYDGVLDVNTADPELRNFASGVLNGLEEFARSHGGKPSQAIERVTQATPAAEPPSKTPG